MKCPKDHQRVGITSRGYLVAVYDAKLGRRLQWKDDRPGRDAILSYEVIDQMMERFLKGDMATQRDLENAVWASQSSSEANSK